MGGLLILLGKERGSTMPLFAGVISVLLLFLFSALTMAEMAQERARQQANADLAALAGAGALAKSIETARAIDGAVWARNVTLDAMYLAATVITIGSAGAGAEAFAVPLNFQRVTIKPVETLLSVKAGISEAAILYSVANSARLIKANSHKDFGAAVPYPLVSESVAPSQRQKDLFKMVTVYDARIDQAIVEMDGVILAYHERQDALGRAGRSEQEIERDLGVRELLGGVREKAGRIGGLTTQRNRRKRELAKLKNTRSGIAGHDGVVAINFHPDSIIPFSAALGTVGTGDNVAIAAATMVDGPPTATVGTEVLHKVLSGVPVGREIADGMETLIESVNLIGSKTRDLPKTYGPLGAYLRGALLRLGVVPPPLNQVRPALTSVDEVTGGAVSSLDDLRAALKLAKKLQRKRGIDTHSPDVVP